MARVNSCGEGAAALGAPFARNVSHHYHMFRAREYAVHVGEECKLTTDTLISHLGDSMDWKTDIGFIAKHLASRSSIVVVNDVFI